MIHHVTSVTSQRTADGKVISPGPERAGVEPVLLVLSEYVTRQFPQHVLDICPDCLQEMVLAKGKIPRSAKGDFVGGFIVGIDE